MEPVNCFSGNIYCRIETKSQISSPYIIINCFWYSNNIKSFLRQKMGGF